MNYTIQQLTYLVALETYRSFSKAAEQCHVTQPTLSMQIKKLETLVGADLVDRSKTPLEFTGIGREVVAKAREALAELKGIEQMVHRAQTGLVGELRLGVIPTLAPYIVPVFLGNFIRSYPDLKLDITECKTDEIIERIKSDRLDVGLLATPLYESGVEEEPLFYEQMLCYMSAERAAKYRHRVEVSDIIKERMWLLSEGNCFRNQSVNLCAMQQLDYPLLSNFTYESGSLEALMRLVDKEGGVTIIPELALMDMSDDRIDRVKFIGKQHPVREISTVVRKKTPVRHLLEVLRKSIHESLPKSVLENDKERKVEIFLKQD